ncbi:hypothetical protein DM02DRAFT_533552 [Periconia macrospinosa]|uniref:WW domain-containing protein n=1 Tax=Periconia macrospinosa TaxID=97972 RepID=A0A2V1DGK5_9PLEO|nr:hypothetical protein DM02DRAFT_533552 [Periconia macrospinosa]
MASTHPKEAPPSYETATGSSSTSEPTPGISRVSTDGPSARRERNGIPPEHRRSMEDLTRPLPEGWVRSFDPESQHQFFVDTRQDPPRSIWTHPYDDPEYLSTLSPEERKEHARMHRTQSIDDIAADSSDDDDGPSNTFKQPHRAGAGSVPATLPDRGEPAPTGFHKFTRKMKDKITGTTHQEREAQRAQRAEQERRAYQQHLKMRQAMIRAMETGEPQLLGTDRQGREVYIEPPPQHGFGGYPGRYGNRGYGYNPYNQGMYASPSTRYMRPVGPYGRPYGYGYGGGLGAPLAAGILGGALLGGVLF